MNQGQAVGQLDNVTFGTIPTGGKIFALLCVPFIVLAVYYAPTLTSFGWHVIHGQTIDYRGLHVRVPWGWTADMSLMADDSQTSPQGVTLQKPPKTLNIESRGPELIYVNLLLPDARSTPSQQEAEWDNLFRQSHPESSFDVVAAADFPQGVDCLEATPKSADSSLPAGAALACISVKDGWLANFAGSRASIPLFRRVLDGLKSAG